MNDSLVIIRCLHHSLGFHIVNLNGDSKCLTSAFSSLEDNVSFHDLSVISTSTYWSRMLRACFPLLRHCLVDLHVHLFKSLPLNDGYK